MYIGILHIFLCKHANISKPQITFIDISAAVDTFDFVCTLVAVLVFPVADLLAKSDRIFTHS